MTHNPKLAKLVYLTILCLFYCILCSDTPALAGEITIVEIAMWEDYTHEEKDFLRGRWEMGRVDSVAEVLEGWNEILASAFYLDHTLFYKHYSNRASSLFTALAGNFTIVPLKEWKEYSDGEKTVLEMRWTNEKVDSVVIALKERREMPEFVARLPPIVKPHVNVYVDGPWETYLDLRRIQLQNHDLDSVHLLNTYLQGANLRGTSLQGAQLVGAKLRGGDLSWANLQGARLYGADLQGTYLNGAKLQGANLFSAELQGAFLYSTELQGANLQLANLQDADLYRASFDSTDLWLVNLGTAKNIRYIIWGDTSNSRYFIGEEMKADSTKIYGDFRKAEITYRDLKTLYKKELMDDVAMGFHFRESEVRTKSYAWYQPGRLLRLFFLKWTYGYGSRPTWLLRYSLVVIGLFALIYAILTIPRKTKSGIYLVVKEGDNEKEELLPFRKGLLFLDCLYFSTLSFATFGYGALQPRQWLQFFRLEPVEYKPVRWARIFVGIEAALGIWIFALLVTVLFGRG